MDFVTLKFVQFVLCYQWIRENVLEYTWKCWQEIKFGDFVDLIKFWYYVVNFVVGVSHAQQMAMFREATFPSLSEDI